MEKYRTDRMAVLTVEEWNTGHLDTPEVCSRLVLDAMFLVNVHGLEKRVSLYRFWGRPTTETPRDY